MSEVEVRVVPQAELATRAAGWIADEITARIGEVGRCRIALAGGSTPRPVYAALAGRADLDWDRIDVLWGDERAVGPDDEASNYRMARQVLLDVVDAKHVFRIEGERAPREAASSYATTLGETPLDVTLLGMGGDGHTASLFPGGQDFPDATERVIVTRSPVEPTTRISLSLRTLNASRAVFLLVAGAGKARRLAEVHAQLAQVHPTFPAARVRPNAGRLVWIVDEAASAELPDSARRNPGT